MTYALGNILKHLPRGKWERFVVLESTSNTYEVTEAKVTTRDKEIKITNEYSINNVSDLKQSFFPVDMFVMALDSRHATTIESTIPLKRAFPSEPITTEELDSLVFRGLWGFLNRYRSWAAKKMDVSDLDVVLGGAEIRDVSLDSYQIFNPKGFRGSTLYLRYQVTLIPRSLVPIIEKIKLRARNFFLVEGDSVLAMRLPRDVTHSVHVGEEYSSLFALQGEEHLHYKSIPWGTSKITTRLARVFSIDEVVARGVLHRFIHKELSPKMERAIAGELKPLFQTLFASAFAIKHKGRKTFSFHFGIPVSFADSWLRSRRAFILNVQNELERKGYRVIMKSVSDFLKTRGTTLTFLTHNYSYPQYDFLNQLLRRRAKWLISRP